MKLRALSILFLIALSALHAQEQRLTLMRTVLMPVPAPRALCYDGVTGHAFALCEELGLMAVSKTGELALTPYEGKGNAFFLNETAIYLLSDTLSIIDRKTAQIIARDISLRGAKNASFTSFFFNPLRNCFAFLDEDNETLYEANLEKRRARRAAKKPKEMNGRINAVAAHGVWLFAVSADEKKVYRIDLATYAVIDEWTFDVNAPTGIAISDAGEIIICGEDAEGRKRLYVFNRPLSAHK